MRRPSVRPTSVWTMIVTEVATMFGSSISTWVSVTGLNRPAPNSRSSSSSVQTLIPARSCASSEAVSV
jgi:hypothetical protein